MIIAGRGQMTPARTVCRHAGARLPSQLTGRAGRAARSLSSPTVYRLDFAAMSVEKHTASFDEKAPSVDRDVVVEAEAVSPSVEEKRLVRKLDWRIMPIACIMYLFAYLDRTNLGNARLQGLPQDTLNGDPTGVLFDWVNSVFFFSYVGLPAQSIVSADTELSYCRFSAKYPPRSYPSCAHRGSGLAARV
ncbi:hypothetical protein NUW54_g10957 [Trametes sanguinea]|uniref:Uncharacterized protein n=1 Tax=Trametes sanguinea TaxID=158606 RepID=A0ACC1NN60_9APHY|nr:hypothetical protein NUW54_g10957 [Trametes sanguinea]